MYVSVYIYIYIYIYTICCDAVEGARLPNNSGERRKITSMLNSINSNIQHMQHTLNNNSVEPTKDSKQTNNSGEHRPGPLGLWRRPDALRIRCEDLLQTGRASGGE